MKRSTRIMYAVFAFLLSLLGIIKADFFAYNYETESYYFVVAFGILAVMCGLYSVLQLNKYERE